MARRPIPGQEGRVKWKTVIIPFSTVQFWVSFLLVVLALAVIGALAYYQFLSPRASARRLIAQAEKGFEQAIVLGIRELAYDDYRSIQETLFSARKAYDEGKNADSIILTEQTMTTLDKALEKLRSDEFFRRERTAGMGHMEGTVEVQVGGSLGWETARKGMKLKKGDRVRTRGGSSCQVQFDDGSQLNIKADSLVLIDDLSEDVRTHTKNSAVKLLVSDVEASILRPTAKGSRFLIETPGSVAQVEKARMNIRVGSDEGTEYQLLSGDVKVQAGGEEVRLAESEVVSLGREGKVTGRRRLLGVPVPRGPANLQWAVTRDKTVPMAFSWDPVAGAASYRLEVGTDRYFTKVIFDNRTIVITQAVVPAVEPGLYYWRVASVDTQSRESPFSEFSVFRVSSDTTPPFFTMNDPIVLRGPETGKIYISGAVEPGSRLEVDGRPAPLAPDGSFRLFADLASDQGSVSIHAWDQAGNKLDQARSIR